MRGGIDRAICLMQFDARVDAFSPSNRLRILAFPWKKIPNGRVCRYQRSASTNGGALLMMSRKVSTDVPGVLDSETIAIAWNAFLVFVRSCLDFDACRYGLLTPPMGKNAIYSAPAFFPFFLSLFFFFCFCFTFNLLHFSAELTARTIVGFSLVWTYSREAIGTLAKWT